MRADDLEGTMGGDPRDLAPEIDSVCQVLGAVTSPANRACERCQDRWNSNAFPGRNARSKYAGREPCNKGQIGCEAHREVPGYFASLQL